MARANPRRRTEAERVEARTFRKSMRVHWRKRRATFAVPKRISVGPFSVVVGEGMGMGQEGRGLSADTQGCRPGLSCGIGCARHQRGRRDRIHFKRFMAWHAGFSGTEDEGRECRYRKRQYVHAYMLGVTEAARLWPRHFVEVPREQEFPWTKEA